MNFIFHGLWGILGKEPWLKLFTVAGIGPDAAYPLMFVIGLVDISAGLVVLFAPARFAPVRAVLVYMVVWGVWTSMLRPLAGSAWWYFFERAANFGPPIALLLYTGWGNSIKDWFSGIATPALTQGKIEQIKWVLRLTIGMFMIAHGGYGAIEGRQFLIGHFASVGLPGPLTDPETFLIATGVFEMVLGVLVLISPMRPILLVVLVWKVFTELLFVTSGLEASGIASAEHPQAFYIISTLERFGMYGAPAGLFILMGYKLSSERVEPAPALSRAATESRR
jgi:uncharacterized membrane protein HdeD (DUF308 family)